MLPMETNQPLLSWKMTHYAHKKKSARSCSQLQQRVSPELDEQQEATTHHEIS